MRGYLHWSALDNYEWGRWAPTFGLIAVNRQTFERTPKPSPAWLHVDRTNLLRDALSAYLARLAGEHEAAAYERQPFTDEELALAEAEDWGPAEDWSDLATWLDKHDAKR